MSEKLFPLKLYIKHKPNLYFIIASAVLNLMSWFWLIYNIRPQDEHIFLHYTALFGVDLIGPWYKIFFLPLVGLILLITNIFIGWIIFRKDKTIGYLSNGISVFLQVLILIASHLLVLLNI